MAEVFESRKGDRGGTERRCKRGDYLINVQLSTISDRYN